MRPDSFTPRRFPNAMIQMNADRDRRRGTGTQPGTPSTCAATPADDGHGDGEDVVGEQRDAGDLRGQHAEVVAGHDVGAAGARVRLDRLAVREHQDHEQDDDRRA